MMGLVSFGIPAPAGRTDRVAVLPPGARSVVLSVVATAVAALSVGVSRAAGYSATRIGNIPSVPSIPSIPGTPSMPGHKQQTREFKVEAFGTQLLYWRLSDTTIMLPHCVGGPIANGQEKLRFSTDIEVPFKFVFAGGRNATIEPRLLSPLNPEAKTKQVREATEEVVAKGTECPPLAPPAPTADCGKTIDGTVTSVFLEYLNQHGGGVQLSLSPIRTPQPTYPCPLLLTSEAGMQELQTADMETYPGPGLFAHLSVTTLVNLKRHHLLIIDRHEALRRNALCGASPACTSEGSVSWHVMIFRTR
jgi:hypothetical protein